MARMREHYETVVRPALTKEFSYTNPMQVWRLIMLTPCTMARCCIFW